jgi:antirestriction protein ArdC
MTRRGEGHAAEELVAELGTTSLCAYLSLTPEPRADHASWIETWLRVLRPAQYKSWTRGQVKAG